MKNTRIVNLGQVRNLIAEWERVRDCILAGRLTGFQTILRDDASNETVFVGGVYRHDTNLSMRANLRLSAAKMLEEDEPPLFQSSSF